MRYIFKLECPRCKKKSETVTTDRNEISFKCGDCLMNDIEVVEFKIVSLEILNDEET